MPDGEHLATLGGHRERVTSVRFGPDGTRLVSSSADNTVRLWDVRTGELMLTLPHDAHALFSPDGDRLVTLPMDGTIHALEAYRSTWTSFWATTR